MRETIFLSYNEDNILKHLLAIEDHARNLKSGMKPEHYACITKHALQVEEQAEEGISHASEVEPEKVDVFIKIRGWIKQFRKELKKDTDPKATIREIRRIRKEAEKLNREYNMSECKVCGPIENTIKKFLGRAKHLNTPIAQELNRFNTGGNMAREIVVNALVGNVAGRVVSDYVSPMVPAVVPGVSGKTLGDVVIGGVLSALSLYGKISGKFDTIAAVAGTNLLATGLMDLVSGYAAPAPPAARAPAPAPAAGLYRTTVGTTVGQNGALVYID
ncbi:MAG: hypothetical protein ACTSUF_03520 [Candidatus Heimdallarchaeaceae archaeon]